MHFVIKYGGRVEMMVNVKRRYSKDFQQGRLDRFTQLRRLRRFVDYVKDVVSKK